MEKVHVNDIDFLVIHNVYSVHKVKCRLLQGEKVKVFRPADSFFFFMSVRFFVRKKLLHWP